MLVELVHTRTSDGLRLNGALHQPDAANSSDFGFDAVIVTHGVGSNFYGSVMLEAVCENFHRQGIATLRINTRGHDGVSTASTASGGMLQGAAFEIVDHCRHDLTAWAEFLQRQGVSRIAYLGHSLGAIKVLYAQAFEPHTSVKQVIAISPPRLAHRQLARGPGSEAFNASWAEAQRLMVNDQPNMLFKSTFPFPLVLSAATFCDKYGPDERYNVLRFARHVRGPVHLVFGQQELESGNAAFVGFVDELMVADWREAPDINVVPKANHFYSGCHTELIRMINGCQ